MEKKSHQDLLAFVSPVTRSRPDPDPHLPEGQRKLKDRLAASLAAATWVKVSTVSPSACFYCIASKPAPGFSEVKQVLPAGSPQPREPLGTQTHASTLSPSSFPQELGRTEGNKPGWMAPAARNPLQLTATAVTHTFPARVVKSLL